MFINVQNNRISAMVVGERMLAIHLKTEEAKKFYQFLKTKGISCSTPTISVSNPVIDKKGHQQAPPSVSSMTVIGTFDDFQEWVYEFYPSQE